MRPPRQLEFLAAHPAADVASFDAAVHAHGGWVLGRDLLAAAGLEINETQLRSLRMRASRSVAVISGDAGYCHIEHATVEEIRHCADRLSSQVTAMTERVIRLQRAAHARLHGHRLLRDGEAPIVLPAEIAGGVLEGPPCESEGASPTTETIP